MQLQELTGNPRHDRLVTLVLERGYMNHDDLAKILEVSVQTVRRDIRKLSELGLISRHHGGAGRPSSVSNIAFKDREFSAMKEKVMIARSIASQIPDGCTLFITTGTSVEYVAKALEVRSHLRIITNSLRVANVLYQNSSFEVMVPGGTLRPANGGIVGPATLAFIENFRADYLITSVGAIEQDGSLMEFDVNEATITRAMMANARHIFLAADASKFRSAAAVKLGTINTRMTLFTDQPPPEAIEALLLQQQASAVIATADNE
ncbi:DeoR/GlpR transcriptional regulator [Jejubacter calystegiae]|uniref:DeoR/GlpR transcriptional regulator n=1 Tax=Jejubacter calystegiae TaxID=2579935 RepID=A0A4P8YII5_9ENTR|nr:DeoR/GlpR family DNA-binding transcription regulator [Jejubacter calystegiae]QCT20481.1 DeoR/GlpR transcriptional regulator [Jejubacter calystegiae]